MAVEKLVYKNFFVSNRPVLSELPSYFDRLLHEIPFKFLRTNASDRLPGAFNVSSYRTLHDRSRIVFIMEPDFLKIFISRYIFISLESIQPETELKFCYGPFYVIFSLSLFPQHTARCVPLHFVFTTTKTTTTTTTTTTTIAATPSVH
jgi:hypothetical protein